MISYDIPQSLEQEIAALETLIADHAAGSVSDAQLKAHRVPFGVYEQRVRGAYMVRVRTTGGIVSPDQLSAIADVAAQYGSGVVHFTTRQEVQIHDVPLDRIVAVIRALVPHGLSSRGGGGNTVRNIMASWDAGISPTEQFDVTPYVVALTSRLIAQPDSWLLPRKFKIAFSGGSDDNAFATINDLGFIAVNRDGCKGFRVYVAGGMGRQPQPGHLLHDWIDHNDVYAVTEAVKRVFDTYGNRRNRHSARLRFLWNTLGAEKFIEYYNQQRRALEAENTPPLKLPHIPPSPAVPFEVQAFEGAPASFLQWQQRYVHAQKQQGLFVVTVAVFLGVIDSGQLKKLAGIIATLGSDAIRLTIQQNVTVRNVPGSALGALYDALRKTAPLSDAAAIAGNAVACAGATTCQLGLCRSRDVLKAVTDHLAAREINLEHSNNVRINISGCPNTCGQHMAADLGFFGRTGSSDGRAYPAYGVVAGALLRDGATRLARRLGEVPARIVPEFVEQVAAAFGARGSGVSFTEFVDAGGDDEIRTIIAGIKSPPSFDSDPLFYTDWGSDVPFSTEGRGGGECAAGLFDIIDIDRSRMNALRPAAAGGDAHAIRELTVTAAHTLLIARGATVHGDHETLAVFEKEFVHEGLVDARFCALLHDVAAGLSVTSRSADALSLADAVEALYLTMDETLRLVKPAPATPDAEKDLRGVACPMNFVKTKLALAGLKSGQKLAVLLDDGEPVANVPGSLEQEGHRILSRQRTVDAWRILIEKGN